MWSHIIATDEELRRLRVDIMTGMFASNLIMYFIVLTTAATLHAHGKTPLHDAQGTVIGVQGIFWDVTERKRAEEQLVTQNLKLQEMARSEHEAHLQLKQTQSRMVQSEKLASLGQMVAGVAHEINNPVAFVSNAESDRYFEEYNREWDEIEKEAEPYLAMMPK